MTRSSLTLTTAFVAFALAGCAKNKADDTENPDDAAASDGDATDDDGTATASRARGSTSTRGSGSKAAARTSLEAKKPPRTTPDSSEDEDTGPNGLLAEVFTLDEADGLPGFETIGDPSETFEVASIDFDEAEASDGFPGASSATENYGIRFTGWLNVATEAEYELCLHSDDGSALLLEGTLVVDNDGVHDEPVEACELVYLAAGEYQLEIDYFQSTGPLMAMHFAWAIDGGDKVIVPTEVLFKPDDATR
ncbi:hypothetical protein G6O69_32335 [Pseudenhygromyxa sp. WMMC2535]|uniref:PA14 domain-containing protein n=1 Tax=Pseudenhygromyxa sp. WMMC2535 TaxID=2712867 RepID=UPI001554D339|nr:PA14 domain-containing protein [Pseudenhygromyxa sp. WMMC2535]NVB42557.1 hypothetical protein [Pseudenhygromyxa sp. WMMC2535]